MALIKLRPYQKTARDLSIAEWEKGILNTLLCIPTGAGKSEIAFGVMAHERAKAQESRSYFRGLFISHREELVTQPVERIKKGWHDRLPVPGVVMGKHNDSDAEIVSATIQTLMPRRRNGDKFKRFYRLRELLSKGVFTHVWVDEAHHATAPSYMAVLRALRAVNPSLRHLGVTATPRRGDQDGLVRVYQSIAWRKGIMEAIEEIGCLVPFVGYGFTLPVSIADARIVAGDYVDADLDKLLSVDNVEEVIIEKWKETGENRQTIAFTAGVNQAMRLSQAFNRAGIVSAWASAETPKKERRKIISDYKQGKIKILVNCMLWTEGFDAPQTSCVIMARPTRNDSLYLQCVGRGLRLFPGKDNCIIMDFAPVDDREILNSGDLLGKPKEQRKAEEKAEEDGTVLDVFGLLSKAKGLDADPDDVQIKALDFFSKKSPLKFTHDGRVASATLTKDKTLVIGFPQEDRVSVADELKESGKWKPSYDEYYDVISNFALFITEKGKGAVLVDVSSTWEDAVEVANEVAEGHIDKTLARKSSKWRKSPPSEGQITFASRLGVYREGMSRGQVSQAITHKLALNLLKKERYVL